MKNMVLHLEVSGEEVFGFSNIKLETIYGIESPDNYMGIWDFFGDAGEVIGTVNLSFIVNAGKRPTEEPARESKPEIPKLNIPELEKQPDTSPNLNAGEQQNEINLKESHLYIEGLTEKILSQKPGNDSDDDFSDFGTEDHVMPLEEKDAKDLGGPSPSALARRDTPQSYKMDDEARRPSTLAEKNLGKIKEDEDES